MEVKDIIREKRIELGMTMKQLADKVGVHEGTISRWESGEIANMKRDKILLLSQVLKIPLEVIMEWDGDRSDQWVYFNNVSSIAKRSYPLFDGIACGKPILMPDGIDVYVDVTVDVQADFILRCHGDSMVGARIQDGDLVFIRSQPTVENGEIAAVAIDDEATLKRFYYDSESKTVTLIAENPKYPPVVIGEESGKEVRILGKAVAFQSDVK